MQWDHNVKWAPQTNSVVDNPFLTMIEEEMLE